MPRRCTGCPLPCHRLDMMLRPAKPTYKDDDAVAQAHDRRHDPGRSGTADPGCLHPGGSGFGRPLPPLTGPDQWVLSAFGAKHNSLYVWNDKKAQHLVFLPRKLTEPPAEVRPAEVRPGEVRLTEGRVVEVRRAEVRPVQVRPAEVRLNIRVLLPPPVPDLHPLLEQGYMFFVGHTAPSTARLRICSQTGRASRC